MTETASGWSARGASGAKGGPNGTVGGLTTRRIHTKPGVHPYDELTWERSRAAAKLADHGRGLALGRGTGVRAEFLIDLPACLGPMSLM